MRRFEAKHKDCTRVGLKTLAHFWLGSAGGLLGLPSPSLAGAKAWFHSSRITRTGVETCCP